MTAFQLSASGGAIGETTLPGGTLATVDMVLGQAEFLGGFQGQLVVEHTPSEDTGVAFATLVGTNGTTLKMTLDTTGAVGSDKVIRGTFVITGGTGRLAGATGSGTIIDEPGCQRKLVHNRNAGTNRSVISRGKSRRAGVDSSERPLARANFCSSVASPFLSSIRKLSRNFTPRQKPRGSLGGPACRNRPDESAFTAWPAGRGALPRCLHLRYDGGAPALQLVHRGHQELPQARGRAELHFQLAGAAVQRVLLGDGDRRPE